MNTENNNPPGSTTDSSIASRVREIFPSEIVADRFVRLLTSEKPFGWGKKSTAPYYNLRYGKMMKDNIEKMLATREAMLFSYDTLCHPGGMSKQSLYNMVNQSILYVRERMDTPDMRYERWYQSVETSRTNTKNGIYIFFKEGAFSEDVEPHTPDGVPIAPTMVTPIGEQKQWERDIDEWLDSDDKTPFVKERLILSPEDVSQLKSRFAGLGGSVMCSIDCSSIRLIKVNA